MAKRRRKRKKNLSTGAWVAIGLGIGIGVPAVIAGIVTLYTIKKGADFVEDFDMAQRPIPSLPNDF